MVAPSVGASRVLRGRAPELLSLNGSTIAATHGYVSGVSYRIGDR
jgi:hypothetical protein